MQIKKLAFFSLSAIIFAASSAVTGNAEAKFVSTGESYKSSVLSDTSKTDTKQEYKRCASPHLQVDEADLADDYDSALSEDPLEGFNRAVHSFNITLDKWALKPLAEGYRYVVPQWGRDRVYGFFTNLEEPRNFANSVLQLDGKSALTAFWRFTINSTLGIGGLHDVAGGFGLKLKSKDFSTTLAYYGAETGPYFVIPFMGPSTIRDAFGKIPDAFADPTFYLEDDAVLLALNAADIISTREHILDITNDFEKDSFDLYSSYKSGWLQNRKSQVNRSLSRN